ncbi:MAG: hypothetical protein AAF907_06040 [Planctomycetota bacterium]
MTPTLRLFAGPDFEQEAEPPAPAVRVLLGDLLSACGVTKKGGEGRAWLSDFAQEPLLVSPDLAELLHAARLMQQEEAAEEPVVLPFPGLAQTGVAPTGVGHDAGLRVA